MGKPILNRRSHLSMKRMTLYIILVYASITYIRTFACLTRPSPANTSVNRVETVKKDTDRAIGYYGVSRLYWGKNADSALLMAQKTLDLAKKIHFEKGMALGYLAKGVALGYKGKWPEALDCHLQCLRISKKLGMEGLSGNAYNNIAGLYTSMEDFTKALYYNKQAYKIALQQNDPTSEGLLSLLVNIGEIFKKKGQPDSSIAYNSKALAIAERVNDSVSTAATLYNISENYITKRNYARAEAYLYKALNIAQRSRDHEDIAYCYSGLALTSYYTGKYNLSLQYAQKGLEQSRRSGIVEVIETAYHVLYLTHRKMENYRQALDYRNLEVELNDSLKTVQKQKAIRNIQFAYELEQKEQQIKLLNKDKIIVLQKFEQIKLKRDILIAGTVLLLLIAFTLLRNYLQKRKLSEQLAQQNKNISEQNIQLEELVHVKDRLFSIIAHDLKGPIHTISQMMDMLREKDFPDEEKDLWIEKICETLVTTSGLIENLLYWAKSQLDGILVNPEFFDLQKLTDQNVELLKQRSVEKNVRLNVVEMTGSRIVYGDQVMIDIVIRNLLENAVKFSRSGDLVTVTAENKGNFTVLTVKDNGAGIPEEAKSKIFNKLASFTTFGTASEKGSGLGLLLCKELVEKNNGSLAFESKEGHGSSFYFTIPS